ncbi:MAG: hypothetical protein RLO48_21080, partial [Bauldia litoralis]
MSETVYEASIHRRLDRFPATFPEGRINLKSDRAAVTAEFTRRYQEHLAVFERSQGLLAPTAALAEAAISVLEAGGKLLFCGNGGS